MNQHNRTLWIAGDSYGTVDNTDGTHWLEELARYHNCDRILNLSRGGFDNSAINYVAESIISNSPWPGRKDNEQFLYDNDILLIFCTTQDRFCHLKNPHKKFDHNISIANLNWHTPYLTEQVHMPWIDYMPKDSNLYSQTYNSLAGKLPVLTNLDLTTDDLQHINNSLLVHDGDWANIRNSQQLAGVIGLFEQRASADAKLYTVNNPHHMEQVAQYQLPNIQELIGETPEQEDTLVNHLTAKQHLAYFDCLLDYL
jgi:hypothetical protein